MEAAADGSSPNPSWHPSLATSSSSSSLSSLDKFQDAEGTELQPKSDGIGSSSASGWLRRVLHLLTLDKIHDEADEEARHRRQRRRRTIVAAAGGSAAIVAAAYALVSYNHRRRQRKARPLLDSTGLTSTASSGSIPYRYNPRLAIESPLSLLLHHAKKGNVRRAKMNRAGVAYQLATAGNTNPNGNASSSQWRKSSLPPTPGISESITTALTDGGCTDITTLPESLLERMLPAVITAIPFVYLGLAYRMLRRAQGGDEMNVRDVTLGHADDASDGEGRITFRDVAGVDTAKEELSEIVSYLSDPLPYVRVGASPPRGVLLHGGPGVGKTLLARAVAGEAHADCFVSCSGSDFVELYVGQGAKRVRELFRGVRETARRRRRREVAKGRFVQWWKSWVNHYLGVDGSAFLLGGGTRTQTLVASDSRPPTAVIFIDEIDALAKCRDGIGRGSLLGGGNDERDQTVNALLTEMDGFGSGRDGGRPSSSSNGTSAANTSSIEDVVVIVIAATNRRSVLDPAILRPGRFDRHVVVPYPDRRGREAILAVHARKIRLEGQNNNNYHDDDSGPSVLLSELADDRVSAGFSGADLRNVVNEAALLAVRANKSSVGFDELIAAARRVRQMKGPVPVIDLS